ncbi:MAG: serine/threonine protein kinase, partial [Natronospirillum sp.]
MEHVRHSGINNNVVEFMLSRLQQLPESTRNVLQLAACIGSSFDLRTLALIHEHSLGATAEALLVALQRTLIGPLNDDYKLVGSRDGGGADGDVSVNPQYKFAHDRVQQAAYELIDEGRKQALHLSVGRLMQRHVAVSEHEDRLFEIVDHLNRGRQLISDPMERTALAQLNLRAGDRARQSSAYQAALGYLDIGRHLLDEQAWKQHYELIKALCDEYQQCAYLTGAHEQAEQEHQQLLIRVQTDLEKAELLATLTRQYATVGKMGSSIQAAIQGLSLLGIKFSAQPSKASIQREVDRVSDNLGNRRVDDLIHAPVLADPHDLLAIRLLMEIFPAAFLSGSGNLFPYLVLKSVNLSLRCGNSPESAFAYAAYGMLLCGALNDQAQGYEYGLLAVRMNEQFDDIALKSRVIYVYTMFIHHWSNPWASMTPWFRKGIDAGYQSGDLLYLAYSAQDCIIWDPSLDLETAVAKHREYLAIVRDCEYQDSLDSGTLFLQMLLSFSGETDDLCSFNTPDFDEQKCLDGMLQRRFMTGVANYHIYKTELCYC